MIDDPTPTMTKVLNLLDRSITNSTLDEGIDPALHPKHRLGADTMSHSITSAVAKVCGEKQVGQINGECITEQKCAIVSRSIKANSTSDPDETTMTTSHRRATKNYHNKTMK